jgi:hypothetical protein
MINLKKYFNSFYYKISKYSQAGQDIFAHELFGDHGTYIDVGAGQPVTFSNTYMLEVDKRWRGFGVEIGHPDPVKKQLDKDLWKKYPERKNKVYWEDALTFDYNKGLIENNLNSNIDFLSCDLDPAKNTFAALQKIINDGVRPKFISFETDFYQEKIDYSLLAYNFLKPFGYKIAVSDVYSNLKKKKIFETWFVINSINFKNICYSEWVKK